MARDKDWPGQIIYNHGENNARGTIIAFNPKLHPIIHDIIVDDQGRSIILDCTILKHRITLVNIYAPNTDDLASPFFESTFKELDKLPNKTKIMAGDFNVVLNTEIDKLGGNPELHQMPRNIILNNIENFNLTDIWHHLHPQEKQFTYFKLKPQKVFSRLDYFLISDDLIGLTKSSTIIPGFKTDHSSVEFTFNIEGKAKGPGYWRFDKTLLYDREYILKVKDSIQQTVQDNPNTDNDILFDIIKCNIRHLSMQYVGQKRRKDKQKIENLETQIALLQHNLMTNCSENTVSQIKNLKAELNSIYDTKVKMKMLNNRIAFYEDYEKNNKFFFQTGKQHYTDNTIQELELNNGSTVDQTADILQEQKKFYENLYTSKFQKGNTTYDPQYEKEFFPQSEHIPRILKEDRDNLEKPITQEEMLQALKGMQNDKSPGLDEFPAEFYKFFWQDIKNYLFN